MVPVSLRTHIPSAAFLRNTVAESGERNISIEAASKAGRTSIEAASEPFVDLWSTCIILAASKYVFRSNQHPCGKLKIYVNTYYVWTSSPSKICGRLFFLHARFLDRSVVASEAKAPNLRPHWVSEPE